MESYALLFGALLALVLAGFFSAVEMAYVSVNRLYFELHSKQGPLGEKLVSGFLKNPILFVGTTLTGNTLFLVLYTVLGVTVLNPLLMAMIPDAYDNSLLLVILETFILTVVFLPLADYLPKSLALIHPDRFLEWLAVPLWIIYQAIAPIVRILVGTARFFIRFILGKRNPEIRPVFGLTDLNHYLQQLNQKATTEEDVEIDTRIFNNAIEFRDVRVRDCLVPRTEIAAVAVDDSVEELRQAFQDSGHSKIVVYRDTIDDVIGYCHALALFKKPATVEEIITPIIIVPETMPAQDLLLRFLSERKSLALVVDEFGGTAGIVSVEDMVEQIFGEIQDEYDTNEDWVERQIDDTNWLLSARHEIDDLNEKYGWTIPEGDYDTLGGLILATHEDLPAVGEIIEFAPFSFTIISMDGTRIDTVKVRLNRKANS
ncbi:HlyC/CorC family transporter [Spirosoma taeanense]|uniref:HlyC/CorC family transporter n=1 Tax=Spirosoma taeanense TaxID=2735870 RepID=A0A6M5Y682_9BACT|nr:hemolysin family protein [Spirosoma taeanense]QJW89345.1 HlyC/CorC family transporter [Spirosoma taeanense]